MTGRSNCVRRRATHRRAAARDRASRRGGEPGGFPFGLSGPMEESAPLRRSTVSARSARSAWGQFGSALFAQGSVTRHRRPARRFSTSKTHQLAV
jgi:hypothetical protein